MLEIYDRVIPSKSIPTLVGLCLVALLLYVFQGLLDVIRGRILLRIGSSIEASLGPRVFTAVRRLPLRGVSGTDALQPIRDLDAVRGFVSSTGPQAFFDLPWIPFYVAICWAFHPFIGMAAIGGAALLFILALLSEARSRGPAKSSSAASAAKLSQADAVRRNAEVVQALGMGGRLASRYEEKSEAHRLAQQDATDVTLVIGGFSKVFRMALQSGVLALGAWLVIQQQATSGVIIAASILTARALAPAELAIANWKGFVHARQSWRRLNDLLSRLPEPQPQVELPAPHKFFDVQGVWVAPPGTQRFVVQDAGFALKAGQGLGVIGPSGSGKTSLVRLLTGVWVPARGKVRIDGAPLDQWEAEDLGRHLGYLPQDVELFAGTVAENISRFDPQATDKAVIAAAQAAGVHDLILSLPAGYSTPIGEGGSSLSAGQRQRIALARALYGDPFVVVLDEPNSNLDTQGEEALTSAILGVRARGGIVVVVAHRPSALSGVDMLLGMADGRVGAFGPKEEVMHKLLHTDPPPYPWPLPATTASRGGMAPAPANAGSAA